MFRRILAAVATLALALVLLVLVWPQLFGLERTRIIAQAVSFRGMAFALALAVVVLLIFTTVLSRTFRRAAATAGVMLLAFALITLGVLGIRGLGNPSMPTKADGEYTVLSWNTLGDAPGAEAIAQLAIEQQADVVALPETSTEAADQVVAIMAAAGRTMQPIELSFDKVSKARTTVVLMGERLGEYRRDDTVGSTTTLPSVVAVPVDGTGPTIIAAHPVAPVPGEMEAWRAGLTWLAERCQGPNVIVAGDLNATLDHFYGLGTDGGELGACFDAAKATGNAAVGTWPTSLPGFLATPIDHVLATDGWQVVGFRVIGSHDGSGSDHRPVVAQLRPLK